LKGDTTCDGKIMAKDGTGILLNAVNVISEDDMKKPDYRAGLITQTVPTQMAKEASKINLHAVGNLDINEDYSLS